MTTTHASEPPTATRDTPSIAVIVPNFDGAHLLPACLDALLAQSRRPDEIVVVDDASRDDSRALLARAYPQVRVIALATNRGFPGAVNAGVAAAKADYVALLNNDAIADREFIHALADAAARYPDVDAFACLMLKATAQGPLHPSRIDSAGLALASGFAQLSRGDGELDGKEFDAEREVLGSCGGAALWRRSTFEALHGFDERYVAYFEDYDLALRLLLANGRTVYVRAAKVHHLGSATLGRHSARGTYLYARNSLFLIGTAIPFANYAREMIAVEWRCVRMLVLALRRGRFLACLAGLVVGKFLLLRECLRRAGRPLASDARARARLTAYLREGDAERRTNQQRRAE